MQPKIKSKKVALMYKTPENKQLRAKRDCSVGGCDEFRIDSSVLRCLMKDGAKDSSAVFIPGFRRWEAADGRGLQLPGRAESVVWGQEGALQMSLQKLWMPELLKGWYRQDLIKSYSDAHMAAKGS